MGEPGGIRKRLREALAAAVRTRDGTSADALRSALSAIANAEAVEDSSAPAPGHAMAKARLGVGAGEGVRRDLSEGDLIAVLRGEITELLGAASDYERRGRAGHAGRLRAEADALLALLTAE